MADFLFGHTVHFRYQPVKHRFSYPIYMIKIPIDQLDSLSKHHWFFGYNQNRLLSIRDQDYLMDSHESILDKIKSVLNSVPLIEPISSIHLVTIPRFFQKVFKPISFYLCYDQHQKLMVMVAEVTNTYHETHLYVMKPEADPSKAAHVFKIDKAFHVSPFFEEDGSYRFSVNETDSSIAIHIDYNRDDLTVFYANFVANKTPFTTLNALRILFIWPFNSLLILPRIYFQAAQLYFRKRLPAQSKPRPVSANTIRMMPLSWLDRLFLRKLESVCSHLRHGFFRLILPNGETHEFGDKTDAVHAVIDVSNTRMFRRVLLGGEMGLGESYMYGDWDSPELVDVISYLIQNKSQLESEFSGISLVNIVNGIQHILRKNHLAKAQKNISEHYDLGNSFYQLFLDQTMTYSSGLFNTPHDTLEQAHYQKVLALVTNLSLKPGDHVLEIGSGWGFVAVTLAKEFGCLVTTLTLSTEQQTYVEALIQSEGLSDKISVKLQDYRLIEGQFDAIISVEMIEAVGHDFLPLYFDTCYQRLKPGGRFALQAITYPDSGYDDYCRSTDFIRKHIFPGGHLPSLNIIQDLTIGQGRFSLELMTNIASSYAMTLRLWRTRFLSREAEIMAMGFDTVFFRKWVYYFAYCEAAFDTGFLGCHQVIFQKIGGEIT